MTIIHVTPAAAPSKGGVETHVTRVVELQQKSGYQVSILTKAQPHTKLSTWLFIFKHLNKLVAADVVQVHDVFWWLLPVYPVLWLRRKKIITTFHGWEGTYPIRWQAKLQRWVYNQLSTKSVHVGAWIQEFYWDKPDLVIYGGVDQSEALISSSQSLKLVFIGRLEPENDIEKYLEFVNLLKQRINVDLIWVGDGSYHDDCAKVGVVTGMVDDTKKYLDEASVVLAASYLSILQAQAAGKIVVSLYSHKLKQRYLESYPGSAFLLMSNQPRILAESIAILLRSSKDRHQLEQAAKQFAIVQTWQKIVKQYEELWQ